MKKLEVELCGIRMRNPLMLAAGVLGISPSLLKRVADAGAGAVVTKSLGVEPREGFSGPVLVDLGYGLLNAMGLPNPGVKEFCRELEEFGEIGVPVVASVYGFSVEEYVEVAAYAERYVDAVELNVSCPHVEKVGVQFGQSPELLREVVEAVKSAVRKPVFVKLTPNVANIAKMAIIAEDAGADAIVAINTVRGLAINPELRRPELSAVFGGLSGPAIKPIALRCVYEIYQRANIPVVGCGGILTWRDAVEFLMAGASAIQIGSAIYYRGVGVFSEISRGLSRFLDSSEFSSVEELVGIAHRSA